jgi:hypothetical protein
MAGTPMPMKIEDVARRNDAHPLERHQLVDRGNVGAGRRLIWHRCQRRGESRPRESGL